MTTTVLPMARWCMTFLTLGIGSTAGGVIISSAHQYDAAVFYDTYNDLTPGCSAAAFSQNSGQLLGACFYHPHERHVSLGIMSVHTAHRGQGIGRALVNEIVRFTEEGGYLVLRLVSSAMNMDSFPFTTVPV